MKDNYKIVRNHFTSITVFQFFPLWDSLGPRTLPPGEEKDPRTPKPHMRNSTPIFIFNIFKIIGIRNSLYILLLYSLVQNSANLCFCLNSVRYFWFVTRKFSSLYISKFNISDTEPITIMK